MALLDRVKSYSELEDYYSVSLGDITVMGVESEGGIWIVMLQIGGTIAMFYPDDVRTFRNTHPEMQILFTPGLQLPEIL